MIRLNTEKGIVKIANWEDITSRPGFRARIDPKQEKLKAIIGSYQFPDEVHCGLPCNQPHLRGYLVETVSGLETNIGKDCGKKFFSVDFEAMRIRFDRDVLRKEREDTVRMFKARLPRVRNELNALREGAASTVYRQSRPLLEQHRGLPSKVVAMLNNMIRTGSADVYVEREATRAERELAEARGNRSQQVVRERIGSIAGMGFFAPDLDLHHLIGEDMTRMLDIIEEMDEQNALDKPLREAAKWASGVDAKLDQIRRAIELGHQLLTQDNLGILAGVLNDRADRTKLSEYLRTLPKSRVATDS